MRYIYIAITIIFFALAWGFLVVKYAGADAEDGPTSATYHRWEQRSVTLFLRAREPAGLLPSEQGEYSELLKRMGAYRVDHPNEPGLQK
jgi:hypothetical protein